jgi:nucleotide-binding universal stress UspA family protein
VIEARRFQTILVPTDFSATADRALEVVRTLVRSAGPAEVILAHANFMPRELEALALRGPQRVFDELENAAIELLGKRLAELEAAGVPARQIHENGPPDEVILSLARREHADLIVIGTHGRTALPHVLLGSIAERVLRQAPCPVMTVPPAKVVSSGKSS